MSAVQCPCAELPGASQAHLPQPQQEEACRPVKQRLQLLDRGHPSGLPGVLRLMDEFGKIFTCTSVHGTSQSRHNVKNGQSHSFSFVIIHNLCTFHVFQ